MIKELGECLVCGTREIVPFLDLGRIPLANAFAGSAEAAVREQKFPLEVGFCGRCAHVQLRHAVSSEKMFSEYVYLTGSSDNVVAHGRRLCRHAGELVPLDRESLIVEIGSNDGTVLAAFLEISKNVLGIEPAGNVARMAQGRGIATIAEFFTEELAGKLSRERGGAALVVARNVMAHVRTLGDFTRGIRRLLAEDGLALIEIPYLVDMMEYMEFDTIYHEHLSYFSVTAADRLFGNAGLELADVNRLLLHGGSLLLKVQRAGGPQKRGESVDALLGSERESGVLTGKRCEGFAARVEALRGEIGEFIRELRAQGSRLAGYGAPAKGNVLMNVCGLSREDVEFLVDRNSQKHGLFAPGTGIPVVPVRRLYEENIDCVLLLAWNFADEIMRQQQRFEAQGGRFLVPLPHPQFITSKDLSRPELRHLNSSGLAV